MDDYEFRIEQIYDHNIEAIDTIESSLIQMIENYYENWITMKNPSLENKTLLLFAKTKIIIICQNLHPNQRNLLYIVQKDLILI